MNLNERLASLEAQVRIGNERAAEDRKEVKDALTASNEELKRLLGGIGQRLEIHDDLIQQGKGMSKLLHWIWAGLLAIWGYLEWYFHKVMK